MDLPARLDGLSVLDVGAWDGFYAFEADVEIDVMSLSPEAVWTFNLVLLLGVLHQLRDPISALEQVAAVCTGTLIVETEVALSWLPLPAARVFPGRELNDDATNLYAYDPRALDGLLAEVGFPSRRVVWRTSLPRRLPPGAARSARSGRQTAVASFRSQRMVIHASR